MSDVNISKLSASDIDKKAISRDLIYKALIDPVFRKQLKDEPAKALGIQQTNPKIVAEINKVLDSVIAVERTVGAVADELLCACSVTCSVAAAPTILTDAIAKKSDTIANKKIQ